MPATHDVVSDEGRQVPVVSGSILEQQTRGEIDIQIVTARKFPRSIRRFIDRALEMTTLTEDVAESCIYALPRDGKTVEGPSARFAEICASAWGHMRIEGRGVGQSDRFVTARGTAWDLESNVAIAYEVDRRITDKVGRTFNDDMIGMTTNAATSIALRNAVLKVIPSSYWRPIYDACKKVAIGSAQTLADRRAKMLAYFQKMGVPEPRVLAQLGVSGVEDITLDHLLTLKGLATAIKEGDTSVDDAFSSSEPIAPRRASEAATAPPGASTPGAVPSVPNGGEVGTASPAGSPPGTPPVRETRGLRLTHTAYVKPKKGGGDPYYEIQAQGPGTRPDRYTFRTGDEAIYKEAASFEGTDHHVVVQWRSTKIDPKTVAAVIVSLAIDESNPGPPPDPRAQNDGGDLFR